jgi:malonyl-CoA O-methyltransferase
MRRLRRQPPTLSSLDAYSLWADAYPPHAHNALMAAEESAMIALLPPLAGCVILDLACGTGRYGLIAEQNRAACVFALDNSIAMLRQNPLGRRACASTEALPLPAAAIDGIICALALGHLPHLMPSLREISRVLRPGGWALVSDFHPFLYLTGAKRTFVADGQTYAVEHYPHLYADYHTAASTTGLFIEAAAEPRLEHGSPAGRLPAAVIYRLRKPI